jgi:hypothetical protein
MFKKIIDVAIAGSCLGTPVFAETITLKFNSPEIPTIHVSLGFI